MKRITLKAARLRARLTQAELAERSGLDQAYISKLEIGKVMNPSFQTVTALADVLDLDPRLLRFGHRESERVPA